MMRDKSISRRHKWFLLPLMLLFFTQIAMGATPLPNAKPKVVNAYDKTVMHPAIPLLDEAGNHVLNTGNAYSPKTSCGSSGCHDYDSITHAYHFEMGRDEADDDYGKKRGLPQLVGPGYFGGYSCMGGSRPNLLSKKNNASANEFKDFGAAGFIKDCGGCHAGGGFAEKDREGIRYDQKVESTIKEFDGDYFERKSLMAGGKKSESNQIIRWDWKKSGVVENDCMMCHADFSKLKKFPASGAGLNSSDPKKKASSAKDFYKRARSSILMGNDFFRESASPIWEFYNIKPEDPEGLQLLTMQREFRKGKEGDARGYKFVLGANGKPIMNWNPKAFDENGKAHIPMLRFPGNDNCMLCHRTSNSRRGFFGFGDAAVASFDDDGVIETDYQDDVHKGKSFTDDNGQVRAIENCNTCHSRNYKKPTFSNAELSVDHNFLKGNSDMDVRNDLDYAPNAKSCELCHDTMANNVVPSGQANMQDAHRELWKANGDMAGYEKSKLDSITKTHLDVISCQACHITGKANNGKPIQTLYRYRQAENGVSKIFPYNPKIRYYWKDKNSDHVLTRLETDSVYKVKKDAEGKDYAVIADVQGNELGKVSFKKGRHGPKFGAPKDYDGFMALKKAYDSVAASKGVANPNMQQVWLQSNMYIMSHNVRPSSSSVPCESCHTRKQSGAFSSLVSENGILGKGIVKKITTVVDKRLVDEGHIVFRMDTVNVAADGKVTENVGDILYSSRLDPFVTFLKGSSSEYQEGELKATKLLPALAKIGVLGGIKDQIVGALGGDIPVFLLSTHQGSGALRGSSLFGTTGGTAGLLLPSYRVESATISIVPANIVSAVEAVIPGSKLASSVHGFLVKDKTRARVPNLLEPVFVKIPYRGRATSAAQVKVLHSETGAQIGILNPSQIVAFNPHTEASAGYLVFKTTQLQYFAILDVL
ncbi:MAG: cytochrome C [Methylococcales bacterium]|nr:cytochrome C [Methylococcales bacterium]